MRSGFLWFAVCVIHRPTDKTMPSSKFITVSIAEWGDRHECFVAFIPVFLLIQLLIWQVIRPKNRYTLMVYVRVCTVKWEFKECDSIVMNIGITVCEHEVKFFSQWVKQFVWSALVYAHFHVNEHRTSQVMRTIFGKRNHKRDRQCDVPTRLKSQ